MNRLVMTAPLALALMGGLGSGLAGCSDRGESSLAPAAVSPAPPTPASTLPAPVPAPVVSAPAPALPPVAASQLALDGDGLRIFAIPSGSARTLPFGTPMSDALATLVAVQGRQALAQGQKADCGAAYATWDDGLTAWFVRERFAGWSARAPGAGAASTRVLATASNVGVGSTRAELEGAYRAKIAASTLGTEFTAGNLAGLLDSARPDARIVNLWAGTTCLAR